MKINKKLITCVLMAGLTVWGLIADPIAYADLNKKERTAGLSLIRVYEALKDEKDDVESKAIRGSVSLKDTLALLEIIKEEGSGVTTRAGSSEEAVVKDIAHRLVRHREALRALITLYRGTPLERHMTEYNAFALEQSVRDLMYKDLSGPGFVELWKDWVVQKAWIERTWVDYGALVLAGIAGYTIGAGLPSKFASVVGRLRNYVPTMEIKFSDRS